MRYLEAAFAVVIGYYFFDENYSVYSYMGLTLIFIGLISAIWVKKKLN
jgi:multidrug transporter EmrE-like cation transporter